MLIEEMKKDKKNHVKNDDWYMKIMIAQSVIFLLLTVITLASFNADGEIAEIILSGVSRYNSSDFTKDDFIQAFETVKDSAAVFMQEAEEDANGQESAVQETATLCENESVSAAGGQDLEFSSLEMLEGVSFENVETHINMTEPLDDYVITSPFGYRTGPITGNPGIHTGLDMAADYGESIYAAADGYVVGSAWDDSYGYYVKLSHENDVVSIYAHCSSLCVEEGERVKQGDLIAKVGSTGDSTGNHLHFEIRKENIRINPEYVLFG